MFIAQVFEWPHPQIDEDWERDELRWREITPLAYVELKAIAPLRQEVRDGFMQGEPVDILGDGDGLYVCCKAEGGRCFARLLPGEDLVEAGLFAAVLQEITEDRKSPSPPP